MTYFNVKTFLAAALMTTSAFASCVPQEDGNGRVVTSVPMRAGDFDVLPPDVMGHLVSVMPVVSLDEGQNLVSVCKFFHAYVVPKMFFSWKPSESYILQGSKFAQSLTPRILVLDLTNNRTFTDADVQGLTNLTDLDLYSNIAVTDATLTMLTSLKRLNLTYNRLITEDCVKGLTNLDGLNLSSNSVVTDASLKELTNLTDLNLSSSSVVTDVSVKELTHLRHLDLSFNYVVTDAAVQCLPALKTLDITYNSVITPAGYAHLPNLKVFKD